MKNCATHPMQWGIDDCAMSFANVARDALGYDPGETWRGKYSTRPEALKAVGRGGLGYAFRMLARKHGWKRIDPSEGQVGDPGLCILPISETEIAVTAMICRGARGLWMARLENGFIALPDHHVRMAWSLG